MELQLIRSATIKIKYAGKTILVDLCFPQKHLRPFCRNSKETVDLTVSDTILKDLDFVILHTHSDILTL
jgi:L-ascorbate metabolism protein UlaG (beta-lactamase superfamily)